jgi:16S rRNA processing protein RimM
MTLTPFVPLGRVMKAHGLKGEVSVAPATDLPFVLPEGLEVWLVPPPAGVRSGRVEAVRPGPRGPLVKISGVDDIGLAQSLIGSELVARADDLPPEWLEPIEEEGDVIGYGVLDTERGDLGEIVEIIVTGANDVWVVDGPFGEVLLPVIDDVVLAVDDAEKSIRVRLLAGLLPEEPATR